MLTLFFLITDYWFIYFCPLEYTFFSFDYHISSISRRLKNTKILKYVSIANVSVVHIMFLNVSWSFLSDRLISPAIENLMVDVGTLQQQRELNESCLSFITSNSNSRKPLPVSREGFNIFSTPKVWTEAF